MDKTKSLKSSRARRLILYAVYSVYRVYLQSGIEFFFRHVGMMGLQIPGHTYIPVVRLEKSIKRRRGQWQISISC